ncbi:MAG: tetratricopeptide repeat protein [Anaerolineales bacterium]
MSKNFTFPTRVDPINLPRRLREGLGDAEKLLNDNEPQQALETLTELKRHFPNSADVLGLMSDAYYDLQDMHGYLWAMYQLHHLIPNRMEANLGLAGAYLANARLGLALRAFRGFLKKWPRHEEAEKIKKTIATLETALTEILAKLDFTLEEGLDFACKHEELQMLMEHQETQRCKQLAESLLKQRPSFAPIWNNLSQVYWIEGNLPKAIETCEQVLKLEPDNIHALSNISRYLFIQGRQEEVILFAEKLKASYAEASEGWIKKAEALCFIGDDEGAIALLDEARQAKAQNELNEYFYHWMAVSAYRLGQESQARRYWNKALKIGPNFSLTTENLEELKKPASEQNAPWAFSFSTWFPHKTIQELLSLAERTTHNKKSDSMSTALIRYLDLHSDLLHIAPALLDRGDPHSKDFIIKMADFSAHPKLLAALKEFAFGQNGPDNLRMAAAQVLSKHDQVETGEARLWLNGEWQSTILMGFEITDEPDPKSRPHPKAQSLLAQALDALHKKDGKSGEELIRKALVIDPNAPSLHNNLAVALEMQGRKKEASALADQIIEQYPDYFFGQISAARKTIYSGDLKKAREILNKLMTRKQYHVTEFSALCSVFVDLSIEDDQPDVALSWFEMWEGAYPEDPRLEEYQERITMLRLFNSISKDIGSYKRKRKQKR